MKTTKRLMSLLLVMFVCVAAKAETADEPMRH